jgi:hypothetical protein
MKFTPGDSARLLSGELVKVIREVTINDPEFRELALAYLKETGTSWWVKKGWTPLPILCETYEPPFYIIQSGVGRELVAESELDAERRPCFRVAL